MDKYFSFLKKPFSFQGRIIRVQYFISLSLFIIYSCFTILFLLPKRMYDEAFVDYRYYGPESLIVPDDPFYPKPKSLIAARKDIESAEEDVRNYYQKDTMKSNQSKYDTVSISSLESIRRDKYSNFMVELSAYQDDRTNFRIVIMLISILPAALFLIASGTKRSHDFGDSGILQIIFPIYVWLLLFKNSEKEANIYGAMVIAKSDNIKDLVNNEFELIDYCPHCKSPNTKKIRICEWCGNQIC